MNQQLPLLSIREQPEQKEPSIPTKTIRAYVRDALRGFQERQWERERIRTEQQKRYLLPRAKRPELRREIDMRAIKVTYRAVFTQPQGPLNPMGLKIPGPQPVELFQAGTTWKLREIATARRVVFERLPKFASCDVARVEVPHYFRECLESWQIWGMPYLPPAAGRDTIAQERPLIPGVDICDLGNGQWGWYTPDDRTHILHGATIPPGARIPPAACGATVDAKRFVSTRANVEPTCPQCAEVYRKEYAGR